MHKMQTIVTDDRGVCHMGLFSVAFAQSLWPLVVILCTCNTSRRPVPGHRPGRLQP